MNNKIWQTYNISNCSFWYSEWHDCDDDMMMMMMMMMMTMTFVERSIDADKVIQSGMMMMMTIWWWWWWWWWWWHLWRGPSTQRQCHPEWHDDDDVCGEVHPRRQGHPEWHDDVCGEVHKTRSSRWCLWRGPSKHTRSSRVAWWWWCLWKGPSKQTRSSRVGWRWWRLWRGPPKHRQGHLISPFFYCPHPAAYCPLLTFIPVTCQVGWPYLNFSHQDFNCHILMYCISLYSLSRYFDKPVSSSHLTEAQLHGPISTTSLTLPGVSNSN